jgi:anti-sigma regulatory factor (Ser/Thr protein kinase)
VPPVTADPSPREGTWVAVDEAASVPTARRCAGFHAAVLGFSPELTGEVELVASELATNLVKHGGGGDLVVRTTSAGSVQLLSIDSGPGAHDLVALTALGVSTTGTLGVGLPAVQRLSSRLDLWSEPGRGAVLVAEVGDGTGSRPPVGHLVRPSRGEQVCGDAVAWRRTSTGWLLAVVGGAGRGEAAAGFVRLTQQVLQDSASESPTELLHQAHAALDGSPGAAVAIGLVDVHEQVLTHAAVGDVSGRIVGGVGGGGGGGGGGGAAARLPCQPGVVGRHLPRVHESTHDLAGSSLVVLHSDGVTDHWDERGLPDVQAHGPDVCAAALLRDAGTRHDDAGVLALQLARVPRPRPSS